MTRRLWLMLTAAWSGAAVMAFELAGARLLMPWYGMGIDVWAAAIAVTLSALAVGYWTGGRVADAWPMPHALGTVLGLAGACVLAVRCWGPRIVCQLADVSSAAGSWCSAAAILTCPLLMLGMVQPLLARLTVRSVDGAGKAVGGLLAASTLGGVAGTILTGLVLVPRLGVSATLLCLGVGTFGAAAAAFLAARGRGGAAVAGLVAVAGLLCAPREPGFPGAQARVLDRVDSPYGCVEVVEHGDKLSLLCNRVVQTTVVRSGMGISRGTLIRSRDYVELVPYFRPGARTALLIGLGGALHEQCLALYGIDVHCVEIDPHVVRLAAEHFGLAADVTVCDGRAFLARADRQFDAIVIDAFIGGSPPEHLYTLEAFERVNDCLAADGLVAIHLIGRPSHTATRAVGRTLEAVFPCRAVVRSGLGDELQHLYLFASHRPLQLQRREVLALCGFTGEEMCHIETAGAPLLTDDRTCLSLLTRDVAAACRRRSRAAWRVSPW